MEKQLKDQIKDEEQKKLEKEKVLKEEQKLNKKVKTSFRTESITTGKYKKVNGHTMEIGKNKTNYYIKIDNLVFFAEIVDDNTLQSSSEKYGKQDWKFVDHLFVLENCKKGKCIVWTIVPINDEIKEGIFRNDEVELKVIKEYSNWYLYKNGEKLQAEIQNSNTLKSKDQLLYFKRSYSSKFRERIRIMLFLAKRGVKISSNIFFEFQIEILNMFPVEGRQTLKLIKQLP